MTRREDVTSLWTLRGRVVVVTGAAAGIGRAICEWVSELGARVVVVDTDAEHGKRLVDHLRRQGGDAQFMAADVSHAADVEAYVEAARSHFGRLDGLVNNAGIEGVITPTVSYPLDVFDRVLAVNVRGVFLALKYALPGMIEQGAGSIVNLASVAGLVGHADHCGYVASKHAVVGMTRVAAAEVARHGVRVNAVCPGPTSTRMMASIEAQAVGTQRDARHREIVTKIPARRYAEPREIARVVAFLLSDAAGFVHGAAVAVDGAFTAAI
jgi:NAD(P)-dependent dehydrogenase (short-subunit alcohol dehydrogenase family)